MLHLWFSIILQLLRSFSREKTNVLSCRCRWLNVFKIKESCAYMSPSVSTFEAIIL